MAIADTAPAAGRPMLGIGIAAMAVASFALGDTLTKTLTQTYPVTVVIAVRFALNLVLLVAFLGPRHGAALWRTRRTGMVALRGVTLGVSSMAMAAALRDLPLGEAVSIVYLAPVVVVLLSGPVLGEWPTRIGVACAVAAFCGVVLIARPGAGLVWTGVAFALGNVGLTAVYHLTTRLLARTETAVAMQVWVAAMGLLVTAPLALMARDLPAPGWDDLAEMAGLGVLMTVGHYLFTLAYREASATLVAPFTYLHLLWGVLFGWLIFAHVPDGITLTGIALIAGSGAVIAVMGRRDARRAVFRPPQA